MSDRQPRHRWIDRRRTYGSWHSTCAHCGIERDQRFAYGTHWTEWRRPGGEWFRADKTPPCESIEPAATPDPQHLSPHVTRYLARVDAHLDTIQIASAREEFLERERDKWERRYADFARRVDARQPTDPAVTAWDYVDTISELSIRISRCRAQAA